MCMERNNLLSVFSIQGGNAGKNISLMISDIFAEKTFRNCVYIPVGTIFDNAGDVSLTEIYFDFIKGRPVRFSDVNGTVFLKPFNCFAEESEIPLTDYMSFIQFISRQFEIAVLNVGSVSPELLKYLLEESMTSAIVIDCGQEGYDRQTECFIKNIKLLWGTELSKYLKNMIFILKRGEEANKNCINELICGYAGTETSEFSDRIFLVQEDFNDFRMFMRKHSRKENIFTNIISRVTERQC